MVVGKNTYLATPLPSGVFRTLSNISDGAFCKNIQRLLALTIFA